GEDTEFYEPVYPGDVISSVTRIAAIEEKTGRSGRFVLVTRETVYTNQDGVVVARSRNSSIVR
ncbi:MAG TPA: MaoC family dehydratase N-terminal domain-containing protein, partial [Dehalococcoidia bacterium]|nr:MaoC family dehydratase N-terminal domain-containing protein [Dehalococcoidia bacterium]